MADKWVIETGVAKNAVDVTLPEWNVNQTVVVDAQWLNLEPSERHINQVGMDVQFVPRPMQSYLGFGIPVVISRDTVSIQVTVPGFTYAYEDIRIWVETQLPGGIDKKMMDAKVCLNVIAPDEPEWPGVTDSMMAIAIEDMKPMEPAYIPHDQLEVCVWSRQLTYRNPHPKNDWSVVGFQEGGIIRDPRDPYRLPKVLVTQVSDDGGAATISFSKPLKVNRIYYLSLQARRAVDDNTVTFNDVAITTKRIP